MKKWITRIFLLILVLLLLIFFGGKIYFSFSTMNYDGEVELTNINDNVEIVTDSMGVPQIFAQTDKDLYFALGWMHAGERLFHMELIRRVAEGRLAEIFGKDAVEFDIFQRKIGFARKAESDISHLDKYSKELIQSYCNGINAWVEQKSVLPPEFFVLGLTPEKWTVKDVAAVMIYQTWFAHFLMDHDKDYAFLIEKLGDKIFDYVSEFKDWSPTTVFSIQKDMASFGKNYLMSFASNSMVISPEKSVSASAIHESDPHLQINSVPGFWYMAGLHSNEGTNIVGITVPSIPFVVMGHNATSAFAFTVASVDLIDYFRWKTDPNDSTKILTAEGYKKFDTITEKIKVKDDNEISLNVKLTPRGPVTEQDSLGYISLWWAGYDFDVCEIFKAGFKLQGVEDFHQFRSVVTSFGALDVNWTYSDKKGNIGYQLGAPIPDRNYDNTFSVLEGEDTSKYVKSYWPLEETPYVFNPSQGFVATSNNQIIAPDDRKIPGFYDPYRIVRANEILTSKRKYKPDDVKAFQQDLVSVKAKRWKDLLAEAAGILGEKDLQAEIENWDCKMTTESKPAAIFSLWWYKLPEVIFKDELGEDFGKGAQILEEVLSHPSADVLDDKITKSKTETLLDNAARALESVLLQYGTPTWGEVSFHTLKHPLSVVKILDWYFDLNRGPFPIGGDNATLNANFILFNEKENHFDAIVGPSMRFILDWSDIDGFVMITNLGQSGNPFSDHYDDFLPLMQQGKYWNFPFNRDKILKKAESRLILKKK
ncbi:MAG: penicillin acylase family protein [Ignavibacteria bacterium]|nr:MAG: penicillin acylase family protein [Ignavibacteria bacterium]